MQKIQFEITNAEKKLLDAEHDDFREVVGRFIEGNIRDALTKYFGTLKSPEDRERFLARIEKADLPKIADIKGDMARMEASDGQ